MYLYCSKCLDVCVLGRGENIITTQDGTDLLATVRKLGHKGEPERPRSAQFQEVLSTTVEKDFSFRLPLGFWTL